jgi:hypothetical protein
MDITKIPSIMRANQWVKGAALMDRWFAGPAQSVAANGTDVNDVVTIAWSLNFPKASKTYYQLLQDKIWRNAAALKEIASVHNASKLAPGTARDISYPKIMDKASDKLAVNFRATEAISWLSDLDDLGAALGRFVYKVAVRGQIRASKAGALTVKINGVGIYIRDSYDFEGSQFLGYWHTDDNTVTKMPRIRLTSPLDSENLVTNDNFRAYRKATGKGGDFLVFSDVRDIPLTPVEYSI